MMLLLENANMFFALRITKIQQLVQWSYIALPAPVVSILHMKGSSKTLIHDV